MEKNLKNFLIKFIVFVGLLLFTRAIFQAPVEYFRWTLLYEQSINRVFSKGDAIKVIALVGTLFILYCRKVLEKIEHGKHDIKNSIFFFIGAQVSVASYYLLRYITNVNAITSGFNLYLIIFLKFLALAIAGSLMLLAVFGFSYLKKLYSHLKKEIIIAAILTVLFYFILMLFQGQWEFFSTIVLNNLVSMFSLIYGNDAVKILNGYLLSVNNFSVSIGAPCSGIDSLLLFFALFSVIFALDFKELKKIPYLISFAVGLLGTFFVNNLRVFLLILVGIHISPKLAVGLFHTHAGWILFIIYFMLYYSFIKKFIYKKQLTHKK